MVGPVFETLLIWEGGFFFWEDLEGCQRTRILSQLRRCSNSKCCETFLCLHSCWLRMRMGRYVTCFSLSLIRLWV
jgi:hypothetical protein